MRKRMPIIAACILAALLSVSVASAAVGVDSSALREAVTADGIGTHLEWFEANGPRVASTPGYDAAAAYVSDLLTDAGYQVWTQPFDFLLWEELSMPAMEQTSPTPTVYPPYDATGFASMEYSGSADVTARVQPTNDIIIPPGHSDNTSNSGCEAADFAGFTPGNIALVQRGTCTFYLKALNAYNAGAVGVIIFNEGQPGRTEAFLGTLGAPVADNLPSVGAAYSVGEELYYASLAGEVWVRMFVDSQTSPVSTYNVLADSPGGRDDRVVVVGAHLDTVAAGAGVNDNGSGSAMILEIALQMANLGIEPYNKVRFAFWSAEESGLYGSQFYVDSLGAHGIKNTALNLNFDMVASPNYVRFAYDGDGSAGLSPAGPNGSGDAEQVFLDYFAGQGLPIEPTAFDGRSDYGPFIDAGIPAGGLFAGADEVKSEEWAAVYGGTAGELLDPNYHTAADNLANINWEVLEQLSDGTAHAVLTFAMTTSSVKGTDQASDRAVRVHSEDMDYLGANLQR